MDSTEGLKQLFRKAGFEQFDGNPPPSKKATMFWFIPSARRIRISETTAAASHSAKWVAWDRKKKKGLPPKEVLDLVNGTGDLELWFYVGEPKNIDTAKEKLAQYEIGYKLPGRYLNVYIVTCKVTNKHRLLYDALGTPVSAMMENYINYVKAQIETPNIYKTLPVRQWVKENIARIDELLAGLTIKKIGSYASSEDAYDAVKEYMSDKDTKDFLHRPETLYPIVKFNHPR